MYATAEERDDYFRTIVAPHPTYDFRVYDVYDNGEFLTFATVDLIESGRVVATETFVASDEFGPSETATRMATSYAVAWLESQEHTLEQRLGPFGIEWEREQADRMGVAA